MRLGTPDRGRKVRCDRVYRYGHRTRKKPLGLEVMEGTIRSRRELRDRLCTQEGTLGQKETRPESEKTSRESVWTLSEKTKGMSETRELWRCRALRLCVYIYKNKNKNGIWHPRVFIHDLTIVISPLEGHYVRVPIKGKIHIEVDFVEKKKKLKFKRTKTPDLIPWRSSVSNVNNKVNWLILFLYKMGCCLYV